VSTNGEKIPGNPETVTRDRNKQQILRKVGQARSRLMVCFYTLPLYMIALIMLLNQGRNISLFMFVYMAVYAVFAIDMVVKKCPGCDGQFYVKSFFLNFVTRKCVHCGLFSRPIHDDDTQHGRKF